MTKMSELFTRIVQIKPKNKEELHRNNARPSLLLKLQEKAKVKGKEIRSKNQDQLQLKSRPIINNYVKLQNPVTPELNEFGVITASVSRVCQLRVKLNVVAGISTPCQKPTHGAYEKTIRMYGNNFPPNRFSRSPQCSPNDQRYQSPMGGPPQQGSPSSQFNPRFMGPPPDRGHDFRGYSPRYQHNRRGPNFSPYPNQGPGNFHTPSPQNRSYGNQDSWSNHGNHRGRGNQNNQGFQNQRGYQKTPYRGGRGRQMDFSNNPHSNPGSSSRIEDYFSPDMLEDPWAEFTLKPRSPKHEESGQSSPHLE
ncbi:hypothetical protein CAPTEDRAFT_224079 [Capitella teleta]|uniref:Uncharacterized protein n=1 Tax=Capitella teleta TaxID=283909 RepID=R7U8Y1_CAPTE|nr:hypothetical protein CAPTEDRAFT_224079 [Capitella teleta]|eukprot:ELT99585.1 hypothetical protein CAPTEDRAFT_224079 [Capitella teleta]